jgi:cellulose synthase/poly-beta-1,6-N-acetylglucosamine synthase-like glycosyltransferase
VSITVPVYNEEMQVEGLLESLLALEYPAEKVQILIVSDGSDDRTEEIVASFADRGVELLAMPGRSGKTASEAAAAEHLRGELILNTDASIRISPDALKPLVEAFQDSEVGVASGRDISVSASRDTTNQGEAGYVGYEMAVRDLETRLGGIVGASGCLYVIRSELHGEPLPAALSRDFASALIAREGGYRAVSVPKATCLVPRTSSLVREYGRKVRTIARGMDTLFHKRHLLNPLKHPQFSWMLFSHKICRWLVPWGAVVLFVSLAGLSWSHTWALAGFSAGVVLLALAGVGWAFAGRSDLHPVVSVPTFFVAGNLAAMHGLIQFLKGERRAIWEPTRRKSVDVG